MTVHRLDPTEASSLVTLLTRVTGTPTVSAQGDLRVAANHVYVVDADARVHIADGVLRLARPLGGRPSRNEEPPGTNAVDPRRGTPRKRPLTPREREVLQLLAEGKASKEIAAILTIALPTVETHRHQLMAKSGLRTIAELTKLAIREGLTSIDR